MEDKKEPKEEPVKSPYTHRFNKKLTDKQKEEVKKILGVEAVIIIGSDTESPCPEVKEGRECDGHKSFIQISGFSESHAISALIQSLSEMTGVKVVAVDKDEDDD